MDVSIRARISTSVLPGCILGIVQSLVAAKWKLADLAAPSGGYWSFPDEDRIWPLAG